MANANDHSKNDETSKPLLADLLKKDTFTGMPSLPQPKQPNMAQKAYRKFREHQEKKAMKELIGDYVESGEEAGDVGTGDNKEMQLLEPVSTKGTE